MRESRSSGRGHAEPTLGDDRATRRRLLAVWVASVALGIGWIGGAGPAAADLIELSPAAGGTVAAGASTSFTLVSTNACVRASADDASISVSVDGKGDCGSDVERTITVSVSVGSDAAPGAHTVTVTEIGVQGGQGTSVAWVLTVVGSDSEPVTTTVTAATTTPVDDSTTSTIATTSTVQSTTTSTAEPSTPATSVPDATSTSSASSTTAPEVAAPVGDDGESTDPGDEPSTTAATAPTAPESADPDEPGGSEVLGVQLAADDEVEPELTGLHPGDFVELFGSRGRLEGVQASDFVAFFSGGVEPDTEASSPADRAPLVPWATRTFALLALAEVARAGGGRGLAVTAPDRAATE